MLEISEQKLRAAYKDANENTQKVLEGLFGLEAIKPASIFDRVKCYEDACFELNIQPTTDWGNLQRDEIAFIKLKTIVKALNEGWFPNWLNFKEYKWFPWFEIKKIPAGLGYAGYGSFAGLSALFSSSGVSDTNPRYGGAIASKSETVSDFLGGESFINLWIDYLLSNTKNV